MYPWAASHGAHNCFHWVVTRYVSNTQIVAIEKQIDVAPAMVLEYLGWVKFATRFTGFYSNSPDETRACAYDIPNDFAKKFNNYLVHYLYLFRKRVIDISMSPFSSLRTSMTGRGGISEENRRGDRVHILL